MGGMDAWKRGDESSLGNYVRDQMVSMATAAVPGLPAIRAVGHAMDPQQREIDNFWSALFYKDMPGFRSRPGARHVRA